MSKCKAHADEGDFLPKLESSHVCTEALQLWRDHKQWYTKAALQQTNTKKQCSRQRQQVKAVCHGKAHVTCSVCRVHYHTKLLAVFNKNSSKSTCGEQHIEHIATCLSLDQSICCVTSRSHAPFAFSRRKV